MFYDIFQYSFMIRAFEAGIIVAMIAPLIGTFLVLRRYSLIADTLAHVSLAGIALGILFGLNPIYTAIGATAVSSVGIEKLRTSKKTYGESALALFLSGSLALAVILLGIAKGMNAGLLNYLFGSIMTVTKTDVQVIAVIGTAVALIIAAFYKELIAISFDEEFAQVNGIPTKFLNFLLILLTALVVSIAIPIVGILLISALMVIPVITAVQFKRDFFHTIVYAECFSVFSVISGIVFGFYGNLSTGGTIVLTSLAIFGITLFIKRK